MCLDEGTLPSMAAVRPVVWWRKSCLIVVHFVCQPCGWLGGWPSEWERPPAGRTKKGHLGGKPIIGELLLNCVAELERLVVLTLLKSVNFFLVFFALTYNSFLDLWILTDSRLQKNIWMHPCCVRIFGYFWTGWGLVEDICRTGRQAVAGGRLVACTLMVKLRCSAV